MSLYRNRVLAERRLLGAFVRLAQLAAAVIAPSIVAASTWALSAGEDPRFAEVERLIDSADFEGAEAAELQLLASGALSRSDTGRAYLGLGIVRGARGKMADAELDFMRAVALDPAVKLPATVGPEVGQAFVRARRRLDAAPRFGIRADVDRTDPHAGVLVKTLLPGIRLGLVRTLDVEGEKLRLRFPIDEEKSPASYVVLAPDAPCQPLRVQLSDEYGNELWRLTEDSLVCARPTARTREDEVQIAREVPVSPTRRPIGAAVWVSGAVTANLFVATSVLGIVALNARADYHHNLSNPDVSRAQKQREHDHAARLANLSTAAGVGAVAALGITALLYLTQAQNAPRSRARLSQVDVSLGQRHAFAGVQFQF